MIKFITPNVAFGNKESIAETPEKFESIINVAHSLRKPYWDNLAKLHWRVWYFKLALPDREIVTSDYFTALQLVLESIRLANKLPLLCHCRAGGHRGPTAAMVAAWYLDGRSRLEYWISCMKRFQPGWDNLPERRVYRQSLIQQCRLKEAQKC